MRTKAIALFAASMLCGASQAQYVPDTVAIPLVSDVFVLGGSQVERDYVMGLMQWRSLMPNSELLKRDLNGYWRGRGFGRNLAAAGLFSAHASFRLGGAERVKRSGAYLRAGFSYQAHVGTGMSLRLEDRVPYDTLTSSQTGDITLVDSVYSSRYDITHRYQQLMLDVSMIFMKEFPRRWTLYGGAGVAVGGAFGGIGRVEYQEDRYTSPSIGGSGGRGFGIDPDEEEEFRTKDDLVFVLYMPLGVSYRLGRRHAFWRALNLCYEMRPSLSFGGVPEVQPGPRTAWGHLFGLRVDLAR